MKRVFRFRTKEDVTGNDGLFIRAVNITEAKKVMQKEFPEEYRACVEISTPVKGKFEYKILWNSGYFK